jgi:uncharacterized protein (DUF488 family)
MSAVHIFTIGFTKKSAQQFFTRLKKSNIKTLIDVRLNNNSQLAAFTKKDDLAYFLKELIDCNYRHMPILAPTKEILTAYKKKEIDWGQYVLKFNGLLERRQKDIKLGPDELDHSCLLCSEPTPDKCHRRLVAEHFKHCFGDVEIHHL